jgi:hypothetical protein
MPEYRIFEVDKNGRVVAPSKVVRCPSDEEVIAEAKSMVRVLDLEIWDGARRVAKIASTK